MNGKLSRRLKRKVEKLRLKKYDAFFARHLELLEMCEREAGQA